MTKVTKDGDVHIHVHVHKAQFAKGGDGHMLGPQKADVKTKSRTGPSDVRGPGAKTAAGGRGRMHMFEPAAPATPGRTSPRR